MIEKMCVTSAITAGWSFMLFLVTNAFMDDTTTVLLFRLISIVIMAVSVAVFLACCYAYVWKF